MSSTKFCCKCFHNPIHYNDQVMQSKILNSKISNFISKKGALHEPVHARNDINLYLYSQYNLATLGSDGSSINKNLHFRLKMCNLKAKYEI